MEDRAATFRKQSIATAVPVVSRERAFRVKVPVALVAFRRFFVDIYHAACYDEVGQLQTLHHLPADCIRPSFCISWILVTRGARSRWLIDRTSCPLPKEAFFLSFYLHPIREQLSLADCALLREFTVPSRLPRLCNAQLTALERFLFLALNERSLLIPPVIKCRAKLFHREINDRTAILQHLC